jgi:hypothetical protein
MPPPIFGRRTDQPEKNGADADEKLGKGKVRSYKIAADPVNSRTLRPTQGINFSIILPNTIHGSKKHL